MSTTSASLDVALAPLVGAGVLTVSLQGNVVQVVQLSARALTIGRLPDNGLVLPDASVSRHHAEVRMDGARAVLTDVGSSSGTIAGDTRLRPHEPVVMENGDTARIGPYVLTYTVMAAVAAPPPPRITTMRPSPLGSPVVEPPSPDGEPTRVAPGRPTSPAPLPSGPRSRYLQQLPAIYQEDEFLGRLLLVFEALWEPLEQRQDHFPMYFDPRTCPGGFLGWLAGWLHLTLDTHWPEARQRAMLAEAMELYRWRGTRYGMVRMIEVCTGITPVVVDIPGQPFTFRVSLTIPKASDVRRELIEELIWLHKPAHVGYVLEVTQ